MSSDAKEHIRDKLRCRLTGAVAPARPRPVRVPLLFPNLGFRRSKMCTGQPSFCLPFGFYFSLSRLFSLIFCLAFVLFLRQDKVGSSIVVPPVFPFFSPCLPCPFVCFFVFSPFFFFSLFFFCIYYEFILAEDLCVHLPLLLISLYFSGGFLLKEVFLLF